MSFHIARAISGLLLLLALAGCAPAAPAAAPMPTAIAAPTVALARQAGIIRDPAALLAALPPAQADVAAPEPPADAAALQVWASPAARWAAMASQASQLDGQDAAQVEADAARLAAAFNDGLALADAARAEGRAVSDDAVLAEIAWRVIAQRHPLRADAARAAAPVAAWAGFWRGEASAPAVVTGRQLGAAVAAAATAAQ